MSEDATSGGNTGGKIRPPVPLGSWINLPNALTLLRMVLTPFIVMTIIQGRHFLALSLFAIAATSDILDGMAARRRSAITKTGAYFDPIADKCLLSGVFLALAAAHLVPWWFVAIVLGRDLYILLAVAVIMQFSTVRGFPPSIWGKISTFVQICTVAFWLGRNVFPGVVLNLLANAIIWPCVGLTVWSGLHYTWTGIHTLRQH